MIWRTLVLALLCLVTTTLYAERFSRPLAVFVAPTTYEMDTARQHYSKKDFPVWLDEGQYNFEQAEAFLKGLGVEVVHSQDMVYTFTDIHHYEHRVEIMNRDYPWSIIMFNGVTEPRLFHFPQDANAKAYYDLAKELQNNNK